MSFKDILNKGVDFVKEKVGDVKEATEEKKKAILDFDLLKTKSEKLGPLNPFLTNNSNPQTGKETLILNACITLSVENARFINSLIPIDETILDVKTSKEASTIIEYNFILTNKKIWIMNKNFYITYDYNRVQTFDIVNKGVMSQGVNFDNKAFIIDGTEADVRRFIDIVKNESFRSQIITKKTEYLLGITPTKQLINSTLAGISFDNLGNIVLHNKDTNYLTKSSDITTIQLLINDSVALSRGRTDSGSITSSPMEARKMSVKVLLTMGEFTIEVMKQNVMNTTYKREDSTYINNYEFAKSIVDALTEEIKR